MHQQIYIIVNIFVFSWPAHKVSLVRHLALVDKSTDGGSTQSARSGPSNSQNTLSSLTVSTKLSPLNKKAKREPGTVQTNDPPTCVQAFEPDQVEVMKQMTLQELGQNKCTLSLQVLTSLEERIGLNVHNTIDFIEWCVSKSDEEYYVDKDVEERFMQLHDGALTSSEQLMMNDVPPLPDFADTLVDPTRAESQNSKGPLPYRKVFICTSMGAYSKHQ
eukprot:12404592-Karenia_brevis.AAC.1